MLVKGKGILVHYKNTTNYLKPGEIKQRLTKLKKIK